MGDGLGQDLRRTRGDDNPLLGTGEVIIDRGIFGPFDQDDVRLARDHGQLFGFIEADEGPIRTHRLLLLLGQVDDTLHPREVLG